jgi:hypothetical protein
MVQLKVLSGKMAGAEKVVRHFPFRIGRSAAADWQCEEEGVWDIHVQLAFDGARGIVLSAGPDAPAAINGQPAREAVLRNGDTMEIGALKIRFWIGPTRQGGMRIREWLTWAALILITAGQLAIIYRLMR